MQFTAHTDAVPPPVQPLPLTFAYCTIERGGEAFSLADMSLDQLRTFAPETAARLLAAVVERQQRQEREKYMAPLLAELLVEVDDPTTRQHVDQVVARVQLTERSQAIADFYSKGHGQ